MDIFFYVVVFLTVICVFAPLERRRLQNNKTVKKVEIKKTEKKIQPAKNLKKSKELFLYEPKFDIDCINGFKHLPYKPILNPVFDTKVIELINIPALEIKVKKQAKIRRKSNNKLPGISKETIQLLKNHPQSFEESVLHYFLLGGTVQTDCLFRELGCKSYNDLKPFFGMYSKTGAQIDTLNGDDLFTGVNYSDSCNDFINDFIAIVSRYPSKGRMSARLKELNTFEPESAPGFLDYSEVFATEYRARRAQLSLCRKIGCI